MYIYVHYTHISHISIYIYVYIYTYIYTYSLFFGRGLGQVFVLKHAVEFLKHLFAELLKLNA